jgi:hypothetical protein
VAQQRLHADRQSGENAIAPTRRPWGLSWAYDRQAPPRQATVPVNELYRAQAGTVRSPFSPCPLSPNMSSPDALQRVIKLLGTGSGSDKVTSLLSYPLHTLPVLRTDQSQPSQAFMLVAYSSKVVAWALARSPTPKTALLAARLNKLSATISEGRMLSVCSRLLWVFVAI